MSENHGFRDDHESKLYEIRVKGHLDARWLERFENLSFTHASDGTTILSGLIVDQAALHGFLRMLRDLGLPLISVIQVDPNHSNKEATDEYVQ